MKLRYSPASPYVRKCLALAHEAGLAGRIDLVPTVTADPCSGLANDNPLGKIPALATDDGQVLFDSPVICEYLDSLHGGGKFLPPAGPARWTALRRQALADGLLDAALLRRYESARPADEQSPGWHDKQKAVITRALDALEAEADRLGDPAGTDRNAAAIGTINSGRPEAIGRAGADVPPHQIPNAPTINSSAEKIKVISRPCCRSSPPDFHI